MELSSASGVEITATKHNPLRQFHPVRENVGTGIIFDNRGYVVTTASVIGEADKVTVTLADGRILNAEIVGTDPETDVAVTKPFTKVKITIVRNKQKQTLDVMICKMPKSQFPPLNEG